MRLFKLLFSIFVASVVLGPGLSYSKFYFFHLMLLLIFIASIGLNKSIYFVKNNLPTRLHSFCYIFFIWYACGLMWSWDPSATLKYLMYVFCASAVILSVVFYCTTKEKLVQVFKAAGVMFLIEIAVSLLEIFTPFRWVISPFSKYNALLGRPYSSLEPDSHLFAHFESVPNGFSWNQNNLAAAMIVLLPFFLFKKNLIIKSIGIGAIFLIILKTESRGGIISFAAVSLAYLLIKVDMVKILFLTGISSIVLTLFAFNLKGRQDIPRVAERFFSAVDSLQILMFEETDRTDSIGVRQMLMKNSWDRFPGTYGLGFGGGAGKVVQLSSNNTHGTTSLHNFWAEIFFEGGVIFFLAMLFWYGRICFLLFRFGKVVRDSQLNYFVSASALSLVGIFPAIVSLSSAMYWLPLWLLLGFSIASINVCWVSDHGLNVHRLKNPALFSLQRFSPTLKTDH